MIDTAIIGAGPYGLSIGAHLRKQGVPFRIFGRPMHSWIEHMPEGMFLKSDGFASNIYDPEKAFTLQQFCAERGIPYADTGRPVSRETFCAYGLAFRERMLPELEEKLVESVERSGEGFAVRLDDGESFTARRVVLAVGISSLSVRPAGAGSSARRISVAQRRTPQTGELPGPQRSGNWRGLVGTGPGRTATQGGSECSAGYPPHGLGLS
jgi:cation diffusion facilitator CzcD-associated flavoprotein CzcO